MLPLPLLERLLITTVALATSVLPALAGENGMACRCLYQGKYFEQGDTVCIRVDGRSRLARCDMALNNTSWTFLAGKEGCPTALMSPLQARPVSGLSMPERRRLLSFL